MLTPLSKRPKGYEGGYLIEYYLWGLKVKYWENEEYSNIITDPKNWKSNEEFINPEWLEPLSSDHVRNVDNILCSGICCDSIEFKTIK